MKIFFTQFWQKHKVRIVWFSFLRILAFVQVLFWPYALARVVNIVSADPHQWREALIWAVLMTANNVLEDVVRLRSKLGLEKIAAKLKVTLSTFFSKKTEVRAGKKTGEAVQAIKKASDDIEISTTYYKDTALQLPINLIVIPIVLFSANPDYLLLFVVYAGLYLMVEYFTIKAFNRKLKKQFKTAEIFWGTTYRKVPEIWRQREDGHALRQEIDQEGDDLYQATVGLKRTNNWRWMALQTLSSASIGAVVIFAFYKVLMKTAPIGDLILVGSYFSTTQSTLNIITSSLSRVLEIKTSLKRLTEAVKLK